MYFIGVDLGTSSVKLLLMKANGQIIKEVTKDYPLSFPKPLWSEQNPKDWFDKSIDGLVELIKDIDKTEVKGIGFSGQMHGLVVLDENDDILRPAILWNDQRSTVETDFLNQEIGIESLTRYTGNIAFPGFTAPKLLWMKSNEPDLYAKINKVMLPKDYLAYMLSGVFATDYADASGTLYLDVENKKWSKEMLEILGLSENQLPKLYEAYHPIGLLKPEISSKLGLSNDVKIIIGSGDQACAAVGGGVVENGKCSISLGTSGVVFINSETFQKDPNNGLHAFCHANGKYHLMGCMLSAAGALKWWVEEALKTNAFNDLLKSASHVAIDNGLYFLPYLMGERSPHNDADARGVFWGLNMTHDQASMTRAVLEGVTFGLRDSFEIFSALNQPVDEIRINGGGAQNEFWCQMIADVLNTKVVKLETDAGPAYGAAILAAVGQGVFESVEVACKALIKTEASYVPNPSNVALYNKKYGLFAKLYPNLKKLFKEMK